ncbi:glycophorin-C isoform X2 [Loxodonta africana]|uniref:glycophorin-C isoform X2 n=1 Tax=Loxodonta africana TaxID=9785 RepID=UPI0030D54DF2
MQRGRHGRTCPALAPKGWRERSCVCQGMIAAIAFVLIGLLLITLHYMCQHKGTYYTNEAKGTEFAESADAALQDDPALQDAGEGSRKEYFI